METVRSRLLTLCSMVTKKCIWMGAWLSRVHITCNKCENVTITIEKWIVSSWCFLCLYSIRWRCTFSFQRDYSLQSLIIFFLSCPEEHKCACRVHKQSNEINILRQLYNYSNVQNDLKNILPQRNCVFCVEFLCVSVLKNIQTIELQDIYALHWILYLWDNCYC